MHTKLILQNSHENFVKLYRCARHRAYERDRRARLTTEERDHVNLIRRERRQATHQCITTNSVDDQDVVRRMNQEFHGKLATLDKRVCSVCLERYDFSATNHPDECSRCHNDSFLPKGPWSSTT